MNELQKKTAQAIVNIFESGRPLGDYGCVTVLAGDTGHLTYGRSQTTLSSGNLALLLRAYCDAGGAFSEALRSFLPAVDRRDARLDSNERLKNLLRQAGSDPVMRTVQDAFFDRVYWTPALKSAAHIGVVMSLSISVVYDSRIHGSYHYIRDVTSETYGKPEAIGEEAWINWYVHVRRDWLGTNQNTLLHKTVYRMDAFRTQIDQGNWELKLPMMVRNVVISEDLFMADYAQPAIVSAAHEGERVLFLTRPRMRGEDVRKLQIALGFSDADADGIFGNETVRKVREFQERKGLKIDGKVGPATWTELGF